MTVAVLGGAGGIGRALVARMVRDQTPVVVLDLPASLERHPPPSDVPAIPIDVTDPAMVADAARALAAQAPDLQGCVNLSGFMLETQSLLETTDATFETVLQGNLVGALRWARAVIPLLRRGPGGSLVHVSSGLAQYIRPGYGSYSASKAGLIALTKTLALECAPDIRVNAVAPGGIETAFLRGGTGRSDESGAVRMDRDAYARSLPLQRFGAPDDVVGPLLFLLGPDSGYMTGQVLWVNGGGYMP